MEGIEQGRLKLSGVPCVDPPFFLQISLGFNRHGQMKAKVWVSEEEKKGLSAGMPVTLERTGKGAAPIFCGVVKKSTAGKEKGQDCLYIEAETRSSLLDRKKGTVPSRDKGVPIRNWWGRQHPHTRDTRCGKRG